MKVVPMKVDLMNFMGEDLDVANIARVSFDKESVLDEDGVLSAKDRKLIEYLAKHNHWSPFSHCFAQFRIKAPIAVARQLQKHVVGLAWNEVSRRYVDSEPEFYFPDGYRLRAENAKQGSSDFTLEGNDKYRVQQAVLAATKASVRLYEDILDEGVAPEIARLFLPQNTMTEWVWSGSLYAFARVCKLRLDPHAQAETRVVAEKLAECLEELFPHSWKALMNT